MATVRRSDRITLDLARARPVPANPGMMDVPGLLPIVGTFDYPEFGTVEHVPLSEAHDPESLASLVGVPFTLDHPSGMVDADNAQELTHGWVLDATPQGDAIAVWVRIATRRALTEARTDKSQLSLGYECDYNPTPGVDAAGKAYTGVQRRRRYNHLAGVDLARVGANARLRFDAMKLHTLKIGPKSLQIAAVLATALQGQALAADPKARADAGMEVAEVTIDGVTLVLPRSVVDQIVAMLAGGSATTEEPAVDAAPAGAVPPVDPNAPPRMDAGGFTAAQLAQIATLVREETGKVVGRHDAAARQRLEVERTAGEILGPGYAYDTADTWTIAADAVARTDKGRAESAKALAARAAKGDQLAAGRLLGHLDGAVDMIREAYTNGGELALELDTARRDAAGSEDDDEDDDDMEDAEAARRRMVDRMTKRPKAKALAAQAEAD